MGLHLIRKRGASLALIACTAGLVACSSPTDKANQFYEKGAALLKQGEYDKARVEFKNAVQLKRNIAPAWYGLALVAEQQGQWSEMFSSLYKTLDADPKHLEAQIKLGRLLLAAGRLDKALAASDAAMALSKDNPDVLALRSAVLFKLDDKAGAVRLAKEALTKDADNMDALVVLATAQLAAGDANGAIAYLDQGLKSNDKNIVLQLIKVQALESLSKLDSAEEIFHKLIALYPQIRQLRHVLAQFYLNNGRKDKAEAEYRRVASENPKDTAAQLDLVRFIAAVRGTKTAMQELQAMIDRDPANNEYKFALAASYMTQNDRKSAEAVFRGIADKEGDGPAGIKAKGLLAANLLAGGDRPAAQKLLTQILAKDQRNEQGLLLKASMELADRQLDQAIADLRTILRDVPDSARASLLLAQAYELAGSPELAQQNFLKAFQDGKMAPAFGMAYGEFLLKHEQAERAEQVALETLRASPGIVPVMKLLAQARINKGDWSGAQSVADQLAKSGAGGSASDEIRGTILAVRRNYSESIGAFKRAFDASPTEVQPLVSLVRAYLLAGQIPEALNFLNSVIQATPANTSARLLQAQLLAMKGDNAAAVQALNEIIGQQPKESSAYLTLANIQLRAGQAAEAEKTIVRGLAAVPGDVAMSLTQAGIYEVMGRYEEAITLYEKLLKEHPNADVVANNLASLLLDHRSDKASIARANDLAKRFAHTDVPQFKDTLGWAQVRLGKADEATPLLLDATKALPDLAVFRYHLGMSYLALNKKADARKELEKALALGKGGGFAEIDEAKNALKGL
ncbi:MAG TPA: tetratricopeptide repeat protein [Rhodocyclaceae bacterium]